MNLEELPDVSSEPFENLHGGELLAITRAEIVYHSSYPHFGITTQLVYVAGIFSISKLLPPTTSPALLDEKFLICSTHVKRYLDGTATFSVGLHNFIHHKYPKVKSIARFTPFEIPGEPMSISTGWQPRDLINRVTEE